MKVATEFLHERVSDIDRVLVVKAGSVEDPKATRSRPVASGFIYRRWAVKIKVD